MNSSKDRQALLEFLRCDHMRNIVPLKMLAAHGTAIQSYFQRQGNDAGVLLLFPTTLFAYDRQTYGARDLVVLLVASSATIVETLLTQLPRDQKLVFKLMSAEIQSCLAQHFTLTRARAFVSYTNDNQTRLINHAQVQMSERVDEQLYAAYAEHGHSSAMITDYFADGEGRAFTLYQESKPVAACFTYSNFEEIHEIGGVLTLPHERRKGYAKLVVESALYALQQRQLTPRYQVDERNLPSIKLAESIGLTPFVTVEHWLNTV